MLEAWKYEPPKALSDVVESLCGAMLVDSGYNYEEVKLVVGRLMEPILVLLHPNLPRDPISELLLSLAKKGCERARFERFQSEKAIGNQNDAMRFLVHDKVIGEMFSGKGRGLARIKPVLAQQARQQLEGDGSHTLLTELCDCVSTRQAKQKLLEETLKDAEAEELNDENEEEVAVMGLLVLESTEGRLDSMTQADESDSEDNTDQDDEMEVEGEVERLL